MAGFLLGPNSNVEAFMHRTQFKLAQLYVLLNQALMTTVHEVA